MAKMVTSGSEPESGGNGEAGLALLLSLITLLLFAIIGLFLSVNATTEVRISDNYETMAKARYASLAGIGHTRELMRGLQFNDVLRGPDGVFDQRSSYIDLARSHRFRNPLEWSVAQVADVVDPGAYLPNASDDGIVNTGSYGSTPGIVLIPAVGIPQMVANYQGSGLRIISRYFVKVTDNNGEETELAGDPSDDPFSDGDATIIVRSLGISQTISEQTEGSVRRNSIVVYEVRLKRNSALDLMAPIVLQGPDAAPASAEMFLGDTFHVWGDAHRPGIATIDTNAFDGIRPGESIAAHLTLDQHDNILGAGLEPSIRDITDLLETDADRNMIRDGQYMWSLIDELIPRIADSVYRDGQIWYNGRDGVIGSYDIGLAATAPSQQPRVSFVTGDLSVRGSIAGGGVLVVAGSLEVLGRLSFSGLILLVGQGELDASEGSLEVAGGILMASLQNDDGRISWGIPKLSLGGSSLIQIHQGAIDMALSLLPLEQVSFREIHPSIDP